MYEPCCLPDCDRPVGTVVVIVTVALEDPEGRGSEQYALCAPHAAWFTGVLRRLGGLVGTI